MLILLYVVLVTQLLSTFAKHKRFPVRLSGGTTGFFMLQILDRKRPVTHSFGLLVEEFFRKDSAAFQTWNKIFPKFEMEHYRNCMYRTSIDNLLQPIHVVSSYRLVIPAELILATIKGLNVQDSAGRTALHWAARSGHKAVVWLLLEH